MSDNYMSYGNAEDIFGGYAQSINKIKPTPITYAAYQALTAEEKAAKRYMITDYPTAGESYNSLSNKPQINSVTLAGNKSAHDLGLVAEESGKGLSSNDYTTAEKTKLAGLENYDDTQLAGRVSDIEGLIPNDATTLNKLATADDIPDTTNFIEKSVTTGLVKNDGTIDTHTYAQSSDLGTAAGKDYTDRVSPGNRNLVESQSVYSAIQSALSSIYTPRGDLTCAELTSALLITENVGDVYEMTDAGTTSALFLQGAGETIAIGANIGIINAGEGRILFNLMPGAFDLTDYQKKELDDPLIIGGVSRTEVEPALGALNTAKADKSEMSVTAGTGADADKTVIQLKSGTTATVLHAHQDISGKVDKSATAGLLKNDGTVDTNTYMTASDIAGKADKSEMSVVDGSGASADKTTITLKSGTSATVLKEHQDISGKAEKSEMSVTPGTGDNADKTTIQLKEGMSATVLTAHQDVSGKVDKVSGATNGNFAGLNASGEVVDSGKKASDFASQAEVNDIVNVLGAKNLLPNNATSQTVTDVQLTVNNDDSVTATGTSSGAWNLRLSKFVLKAGTYILSGRGNADIFTQIVDNTESTNIASTENYTERQFTLNNDTEVIGRIYWKSGVAFNNITLYPMIRLASDPNDTYAPYAPTNAKLNEEKMSYADNGILGAKNILKNNITSGTRNGVTYTANSDGTFTANGTATANGGIELNVNIDGSLIEGMRYKVSLDGVGADKEGTQNGIMLYVAKYLNGVNVGDVARSNKTGGFTDEFVYHKDSSFDNLRVGCYTFKNALFTNSTLKPMIRLASDPDDTYRPYAKTNQELTKDTADTGWITVDSANITNMASGTVKYRVKNGYCTISVENVKPTDASAHINVSNIPKADAVVGGALCNSGIYQTDGWIAANTVYRINANSTNTAGRYGSLTYPVD